MFHIRLIICSLVTHLSQVYIDQLFHVFFQLLHLERHTHFSGDRLEGPCFLSLSNCSQFTVIYTVSVFSGVTEAEVNDFLKFLVPSRIH